MINYLRQTHNASYCPTGFVDSQDSTSEIQPGEWRSIVNDLDNGALRYLPRRRGTRYPQSAVVVRDLLKFRMWCFALAVKPCSWKSSLGY